jgi:hypothetical protein
MSMKGLAAAPVSCYARYFTLFTISQKKPLRICGRRLAPNLSLAQTPLMSEPLALGLPLTNGK